jgi:hypothetical protein
MKNATTATKTRTEEKARRQRAAAERAEAIRALGMAPEPAGIGPFHPEAYAATTGELISWAREAAKAKE